MQASRSRSRWWASAFTIILVLALRPGPGSADGGKPYVPFPDVFFPDFIYYGAPAIPTSRGSYLLVGATGQPDRYSPALAIVQLRGEEPSPGRVQPVAEFGEGGIVRHSVWGLAEYGVTAAVQNDGRIVVVGTAIDPSLVGPCYLAFCTQHTVILRLNPDGSLDPSFNGTGRVVVHFGPVEPGEEENDAPPARIMILGNGDIAIYAADDSKPRGRDVQIGYVRANGVVVDGFRAALGRIAWVFYTAHLNRFFLTADDVEVDLLSRSGNLEWRALNGFRVYPAGTEGGSSVPVCRFYDLETRSHVISANATECTLIGRQIGQRWIFESEEVFRVDLPDPQTGLCPVDQTPVYRLWNPVDGSHALTPDALLRTRLVADGQVSEGWGPDGVAMCGAP